MSDDESLRLGNERLRAALEEQKQFACDAMKDLAMHTVRLLAEKHIVADKTTSRIWQRRTAVSDTSIDMNGLYTAKHFRDAFTEWDRRYREEPERFESEAVHLIRGTPETYGDAAAPYFVSILDEVKQK